MSSVPERLNKAWTDALNWMRDPEERSWILIVPWAAGDVWLVSALAKAFVETHGGPITMVVPHHLTDIPLMYPDHIKRVVALPEGFNAWNFCNAIHRFSTFDKDQPIIVHHFWQGIGTPSVTFSELYTYANRGGISSSDQYRLFLHLNWDTPLSLPTIPEEWRQEAVNYAAEVGVEPGRSVILFPDNNSATTLPDAVWQKLVDALNRKNQKVFVNMFGGANGGSTPKARTNCFTGGHPITVNIRTAIPLIETAGRFISRVNGMAVMLVGSKANFSHSILLLKPSKECQVTSSGAKLGEFAHIQESLNAAGIDVNSPNEYTVDLDDKTDKLIETIAEDVSLGR